MMKKIKFLILALLGIIIIPSAYAVPLDFSIYGYYTRFNETKVISTICDTGTPPYFNYYQCNLDAGSTPHSNFVKSTYNQFEFAYSTPSGVVTVPGLYARDIGESREFVRSYFTESGDQKHNSITLSSRTAYQYTAPDGRKFTFTQVFFHPYQFTLYDPVSKNSLTFLGKNKLINAILLANPKLNTDNVRLVDLHARKAWSITMEQQSARDILLGRNLSADYLKTLQFTKSYTVFEGGQKITPGSWVNEYYSQGSGFIYTLDVDFVAPKWSTPDTNTGNVAAVEYGKCANYRSDIKNLAYYSQKCGDDPVDDETQNWVRVDSWNGSGDVQEVLQQLTGANKNKCGRFANAKKQHWEKYKDEREKFSADFNKYARTAESIDVQSLCKSVELEHGAAFDRFKNNDNVKQRQEVLSGIIKGNKSMAEALQDDRRIILKGSGVNAITRGDYLDDTRYLRDLFSQCRGLKFRGLYTGELTQDSEYYCSLYEIQKQTLIAKYAGVDFEAHNLTSLEKFITRIENIANQGLVSHTVDELKKLGTNILSDLGNQLYSYVQDPYMSGFHQVSFIQCNNFFSFPQLDILIYVLFVAFFFLIFKYV